MTEASPEDDLMLPPVPLATGDVVRLDGAGHRIARIELVVSTDDGTQLRIPLEHHHGGWWPPEDRTEPAG